MEINNYMTVSEAAHRWDIPVSTLRSRLIADRHDDLQEFRDRGLIRYFKPEERTRGEWIVSSDFMTLLYGDEDKERPRYTGGLKFLQDSLDNIDTFKKNARQYGKVRTHLGEVAFTEKLNVPMDRDVKVSAISSQGETFEITVSAKKV